MRGSDFSAELLVSIWSTFEDYIPGKQRMQAAEQYIRALEEFGIYADELTEVHGHSKYLDKAINDAYPQDEVEPEEIEEE